MAKVKPNSFLIFIFFLLLIGSVGSSAQDLQWVYFAGVVTDKLSAEPLEGAGVFFEGHSHIGAFTDSKGEFKLRMPRTLEGDVLVVSFIGFERLYVPLQNIKIDGLNNFQLTRAAVVLNEVIILDESKKLRAIVLDAVANIPANFPSEPHLLEGLYRKISTQGASYTHLEEAAVSVEDYDYKKPVTSLKIKVNAFRQTPDFGNSDSLQLKINQSVRQGAASRFQVASNPLFRTYEGNFLRMFNNEGNTFNLKTLSSIIEKHYEFRVLGFEPVNGDTLLQIAFSEGITPSEPSGNSYFKVSMRDHAIVEFQFTGIFNGRLNHQSLVKFTRHGKKYYPSFIRTTQPRYISRDHNADEYDIATYWFDSVTTGRFAKISSKNSSDRYEYSYGANAGSYDLNFWSSYKPLADHPLDALIKVSLEKHGSLEYQFQLK